MEQGKVMKLFDFRELDIPEQLLELNYSQAAVEEGLEAIREKFLTIEPVSGPVESGDIVVLKMPATETEDAGTLQINVKKNFYDSEFEDSLVGLMPGAVVTLPRRGQGRSAALIQIKRRMFPPLSDALAAQLSIEGVKTLDDYRGVVRKKLLKDDKRKKSNAIMTMILREVAVRSEFGDLTDETVKALERYKTQLSIAAQQHELTYEEMLGRIAPPKYETTEQREAYLRDGMEAQVKQRLVALYHFEQDGKTLNQAGFEAYKQMYIDQGMDRGRVEREFTYEFYCDNAPVNYYQDLIAEYYENKFRVVAKP